jgi:hypothetical protein
MKRAIRGTPTEIAKEIKAWLEQIGISESENDEAYREILVEVLD